MLACCSPDLVLCLLDGPFEAGDEEQQKRRHADGDQREVPVEPEHEADDTDDRQQIDENPERGRGREVLQRRDIVGNRRQQNAGLLLLVVAERQALQVIEHSDAQVVRDPLSDALRVVVVDVRGHAADDRDEDHGDGGDGGESHLALGQREIADPMQPVRQRMVAEHVVDDDLEWPWPCHAHGRLDHHRNDDHDEPRAIRPHELEHELGHRAARGGPLGWRGRRNPAVDCSVMVSDITSLRCWCR